MFQNYNSYMMKPRDQEKRLLKDLIAFYRQSPRAKRKSARLDKETERRKLGIYCVFRGRGINEARDPFLKPCSARGLLLALCLGIISDGV